MALTQSTMLPLGSKAPDFDLSDVTTGRRVRLSNFSNKKLLLVMFICRHCPYVQHVIEEIVKLGKDYENSDVGIVAISSNDTKSYPEDSQQNLKVMALELRFNFPFLFDETQNVAKAFTAACTPDFFLFDENRDLIYRGQLDDSRPSNGKPVTGQDLRSAIDATLSGLPIFPHQKPSAGCNIKWRPGKEPNYFK